MSTFLLWALIVSSIPVLLSIAAEECQPASCSKDGPDVRFPFRHKHLHRQNCGYPGFDLFCNDNKETILELPLSVEVAVKRIDYVSQKLYFKDPGRCFLQKLQYLNLSASPFHFGRDLTNYTLFNCSSGVPRDLQGLVPCLGGPGYQIYAVYSNTLFSVYTDPLAYSSSLSSCTKIREIWSVPGTILSDAKDLQLDWSEPACGYCEARGQLCGFRNGTRGNQTQVQCTDKPKRKGGKSRGPLIAGAVVGSLILVTALGALCHFYRSVRANKENIERFLEDYKALKPVRFTYADTRRITNHFEEILGEGGYGIVYKGKLAGDVYVAVKVLNNGNGNSEEFINEVSIIGRIHHVNVVRLVGFCAEGVTRALVYEFLVHNSLEKFIYHKGSESKPLSIEKLQDIALGMAKGIEYLHHGCDQQILHFDIKPQNILLDQDFNPKISDFGLAKLCSKDQSSISIATGRGTMGYVAPEVVSRAFGRVSCKSDIYSYGMVLLEMVVGRMHENFDMISGPVYFPQWIYKHLTQNEITMQETEGNDDKIMRKLTVIGLWCIQWCPGDRPSMKAVVQMLEGDGETLTMPPNPFPDANAAKPMEGVTEKHNQAEFVVVSES